MTATSFRKTIFAGSVVLLVTGCAGQAKEKDEQAEVTIKKLQSSAKAPQVRALTKPPEVTSETDEGFQDLVFWLEEHEKERDGSHRIRASGTHKGKKVGFEILLAPKWSEGMNTPITSRVGTVKYRAIGSDSDALVGVLDELYETKLSPKNMAKEIEFNAVTLEGHPRELANGPVKIKLFFEPESPDDYVELFTNIDLPARRVEVREKDMEYRPAVIKALQGATRVKEK